MPNLRSGLIKQKHPVFSVRTSVASSLSISVVGGDYEARKERVLFTPCSGGDSQCVLFGGSRDGL